MEIPYVGKPEIRFEATIKMKTNKKNGNDKSYEKNFTQNKWGGPD
jgi:hypothetical protein